MATEAELPSRLDNVQIMSGLTRRAPPEPKILTTIYDFPSMEPLRFEEYPTNHLYMPLRKDLLHRAVVFEADNARQGTASTKRRNDIHGSGKKLRPQKGTGHARVGDRSSPILRGGAKVFGPRPRDFGTKLPQKIYDQAFRTALSYRYRKGELIIVQKINDGAVLGPQWIKEIMEWNHWGRPYGKSMIVTRKTPENFFSVMNTGEKGGGGQHGEAISDSDVDVKDILSLGRLIIEKRALDSLLAEYSSDLNRVAPAAVYT